MEDIRRAARAAYEHFTEEEKREMESEFRSMDKDGDGKIDLHDFLAHYDQHTNSFFSLLDQNDDGFLQFDEILTLSYITSSGRPFCAACKDFIPALFFTCTQCRFASTTKANTFNLCIPCYQGRRFKHEHTDDFDDNYTLLLKLQARRSSRTTPSQSGQSRPRRRTRMKASVKRTLRRIGAVVSGAVAVTGTALSLSSIIPTNTGGEGVGEDGDYDDEDYDNNDDAASAAEDADDPSYF